MKVGRFHEICNFITKDHLPWNGNAYVFFSLSVLFLCVSECAFYNSSECMDNRPALSDILTFTILFFEHVGVWLKTGFAVPVKLLQFLTLQTTSPKEYNKVERYSIQWPDMAQAGRCQYRTSSFWPGTNFTPWSSDASLQFNETCPVSTPSKDRTLALRKRSWSSNRDDRKF